MNQYHQYELFFNLLNPFTSIFLNFLLNLNQFLQILLYLMCFIFFINHLIDVEKRMKILLMAIH